MGWPRPRLEQLPVRGKDRVRTGAPGAIFHQQAIGHAEAETFHPVPGDYRSYQDEHLELLHKINSAVAMPVIASLNGTTTGGWIEYGKCLQQAGADALELNVYY